MVLKWKGKLIKSYSDCAAQLLYIPSKLVSDSAYPFQFERKSMRVGIEVVRGGLAVGGRSKLKGNLISIYPQCMAHLLYIPSEVTLRPDYPFHFEKNVEVGLQIRDGMLMVWSDVAHMGSGRRSVPKQTRA
jgi:hypothetical protein